jgi:hypothetical protein
MIGAARRLRSGLTPPVRVIPTHSLIRAGARTPFQFRYSRASCRTVDEASGTLMARPSHKDRSVRSFSNGV